MIHKTLSDKLKPSERTNYEKQDFFNHIFAVRCNHGYKRLVYGKYLNLRQSSIFCFLADKKRMKLRTKGLPKNTLRIQVPAPLQ